MIAPFLRLMDLAKQLRAPDGCPWDQDQTPESSRKYLVEEAYEAAEAIADGDPAKACEELGDVLFQIVFLCNLYDELGLFNLADAAASSAEKMIRRHPHVFGETKCKDAAQVLANWREIKRTENGDEPASTLGDVPRSLPALMRAQKLSKRAASVGFDWPGPEEVWAKVEEETAELKGAVKAGDDSHRAEELGDLLFSLVNLARHWGLEAESVLQEANTKFERRFRAVEQDLSNQELDIVEASIEQMDNAWEQVKRLED